MNRIPQRFVYGGISLPHGCKLKWEEKKRKRKKKGKKAAIKRFNPDTKDKGHMRSYDFMCNVWGSGALESFFWNGSLIQRHTPRSTQLLIIILNLNQLVCEFGTYPSLSLCQPCRSGLCHNVETMAFFFFFFFLLVSFLKENVQVMKWIIMIFFSLSLCSWLSPPAWRAAHHLDECGWREIIDSCLDNLFCLSVNCDVDSVFYCISSLSKQLVFSS